MKHYIFAIAVIFSLFTLGCNEEAAKDDKKDDKENVTEDKTAVVDLETLYANPGEYIDKEVYVEGTVDHICKHGGKKIFLVQDDKNIKIFGTERFDEALTGKNIKVKAVFKEERIDSAYIAEWEAEVKETHEGEDAETVATLEKIQAMKDSIAGTENGFVSNYFMDFVEFPKDDAGCDTKEEKKEVKEQPVSGGCD